MEHVCVSTTEAFCITRDYIDISFFQAVLINTSYHGSVVNHIDEFHIMPVGRGCEHLVYRTVVQMNGHSNMPFRKLFPLSSEDRD